MTTNTFLEKHITVVATAITELQKHSNSHYGKRKEAGMITEIKEETPDVKQ